MRARLFTLLLFLSGTPLEAQTTKPLSPINPAAARPDQTITSLDGPGFAIAYGAELDLLVAGCDRGTIQFWNRDVLLGIRTGSGTGQVLRGHEAPVTLLAWNGGPVLVSWAADRKLIFWSVADGKPLQNQATKSFLKTMAMSPDGKVLATGGDESFIQLWQVHTAKPQARLHDHKDWISALGFSADGKLLASGSYDGSVSLWEMPGGKKLRALPAPPMPPPKTPPDPVPVCALGFSPDSKTLAVGLANGNVDLINLADGKILRTMTGHTSAVTGLAFHPSGNVLATSSKDRTLRLWNPANGQPFKVLEGHGAWVEGVVFTTRGTRLASVSADQTVRIWDLTEPAKK